jgi:hypothetical protein
LFFFFPTTDRLKLKDLSGKDKEFYESIVVPLVNKCHGKHFDISNFSIPIKKKMESFCETVGGLENKFAELNREYKRLKVIKGKIAQFVFGIDLLELKVIFGRLINREMESQIETDVSKIEPDIANLDKAFMGTYMSLIEELNKREISITIKHRVNAEGRQLAYKLLCIGVKMGEYVKKNECNDEVKLKWAYQQFAANLAINSLYLDRPKSADEKGDLQSIAEKWLLA